MSHKFGFARLYAELDAQASLPPHDAPEWHPPVPVVVANVRTPAGALTEAQRARNNAARSVGGFRDYHIASARWWLAHARSMNGAATYQRTISRLCRELADAGDAWLGVPAPQALHFDPATSRAIERLT